MSRAGQLGRREFAGLAAGALAAGTLRSTQAADATTFVSGFGLQVNLDPHQIFDVPMQAMMLNAYDNLYRYQGDPPKIVPWLAESHTVSEDGLNWEFTHSTELRGGACHRSSKASRGEDLEVEEPVVCRYASAFDFHPTLAGIQSATWVGNQVVQMRQAGEKCCLTPSGMMEALHHKQFPVDSVVSLIQ
jgi:hypothetical protein